MRNRSPSTLDKKFRLGTTPALAAIAHVAEPLAPTAWRRAAGGGRRAAGGADVALLQRNPFELLQRRPANYRGELGSAQAAAAPDGSWVFDPVCVCVGYRPLYADWFDSPSGEPLAWYRVEGAPGPWQLTAKEAYVWQGQAMN